MTDRFTDDGGRTAPRPLYYGWFLVVALGVTTVVSYGTTSYAFGVLVVPVSRDLGGSRAALSGALALSVLVAGILGVPIGHLVDRHGARLLLSMGSALGGACLIGLSLVSDVWQFDVVWGVGVGLATALTFYPVTFTVVTNWFVARRGAALAWLTTLLGGYQTARLEHFSLTIGYVVFFVIHILQVIRAGWNNFRAMVIGVELVDITRVQETHHG